MQCLISVIGLNRGGGVSGGKVDSGMEMGRYYAQEAMAMFDSVTVRQGPERVFVTEQRAPTDDSIRMAEEMRRHILEKVVSEIPLKPNVMEGKILRVFEAASFGESYRAVFDLNGARFVVSLPGDAVLHGQGLKAFLQEVANRIAVELLSKSEIKPSRV